MDAFWAVPEWAPADESHLVGSSSVVTKIAYGKGSVTYSTFDEQSTDVLRLDFKPESVMANGRRLSSVAATSLAKDSCFDDATHVLRIRHDNARDIDIQGVGGNAPPLYLTFDDPHLADGTPLDGPYPTGLINWPRSEWKFGTPEGKFGTFNLIPADPQAQRLEFSFANPRVFIGIDVYNGGTSEARITIHSEKLADISVTLQPGELKRIKTDWKEGSKQVKLELTNANGSAFRQLGLFPAGQSVAVVSSAVRRKS